MESNFTAQTARLTKLTAIAAVILLQCLNTTFSAGPMQVAAGPSPGAPSPVVATAAGASSLPGCPRTCFCNSLSRIVYCSRRGLDSVPTTLPAATLQLNLNGNRFRSTALLRANFSSPTLNSASIEHLYLSDCGIETVQVGTFLDLISLRWLDLSDNRLLIVPGRCFHGLNLQHLFLNGNRGVKLDSTAFEHLSVSGLYLHDCMLDSIPASTLIPLNGTLVNLWLNGNKLTGIDRRLAGLFSGLTHLRLGSNPLRCNCDTLWLKELYDQRGGATFRGAEQPTCSAPTAVRGRHFGQLSADDFRCRAPAFGNVDASFNADVYRRGNGKRGTSRGYLRCTATGEPTPTLYWVRPSGKTIRFDAAVSTDDMVSSEDKVPQRLLSGPGRHQQIRHTVNGDDGRNDAVLELFPGDEIIDDDNDDDDNVDDIGRIPIETGMYICIAANDVGNVTLTVNLSWPIAASRLPYAVDRHATWRPSDRVNVPLLTASSPSAPPSTSSVVAARLAVINLDETIDSKRPASNVNSKSLGVNYVGDVDEVYRQANAKNSRPEVSPVSEARTFSATEMAIAIIGTHVATILLLLVVAVVAMPGCRRKLTSSLTTRRRRGVQRRADQQHTTATEVEYSGTMTREMGHHRGPTSRSNYNGVLGTAAAAAARSTYGVEDSLLHSLSTSSRTSRTANDTSCPSTTRDYLSSTYGSRKYFWPPPSTTGTADFESS